jgi:hypothetical protein
MTSLAKQRLAIVVIALLLLWSGSAAPASMAGAVAGGAFFWWFVGWRRPPEGADRRKTGSSHGPGKAKRASPTRVNTLGDPLVIRAPRIGFLNLLGPSGDELLRSDCAALQDMFSSVKVSTTDVPQCDVLMIYCQIDEGGRLLGTPATLRKIMAAAGAPIIVVASENDAARYRAARTSASHPPVNLVMTLDRGGPRFSQFFRRLFQLMFEGKTMPTAWVEIAPQEPGGSHQDCPGTIFACGGGHIRFDSPR